MRRSDRARTLIVIVLAFLEWTIEPARSAPPETPAQEEQDEAKNEKDDAEKDVTEKVVADSEKDDAEKDDAEKDDAEKDVTEKVVADSEKDDPEDSKNAPKPAEKESAKPDQDTGEKPAAGEPTKPAAAAAKQDAAEKTEPAEQKAAGDEKVEAARQNAARVVVEHLKAAAAAVGIVSESPADTSATSSAAETNDVPEKKKRRKKKSPLLPMFRMRDGTRIAGHADVEVLRLTTAYGPLEVPITDIVQVRFCSPGDTQLGDQVRVLVEQLGSDEFDLREEASEGLRGIGVPALNVLREATRSEDQEVKTRAEKLVAELEEELADIEEDRKPFLVPLQGDEDEVATLQFTAVGRIELAHISVKTPYGQLKLDRDDILSVVFRPPPFRQHTFQVGGTNSYAANNKWVDTGLKLTQGGFLKISAAGSLNLMNYGTSCSPDGTAGTPANGLDSFPVGALVGKIGAKGKAFLIGSEYEGTANATGDLQLGISFKTGSTRGQFEVEVEVEIEEE